MKNRWAQRTLAAIMAVVMVVLLLPVSAPKAKAESMTYTLDMGDLEDVAQGSKADGESIAVGTDGYFNIFFSAKTRIEANSKSFADGFAGTKRLNYGGSTKIEDPILNAVRIKTDAAATVKIWWVSGGDGREIGIYDEAGTVVAETAEGSIKNDLYVSELTVDAAGTYYIGNVGGNNNHYKIEVTEEVAAPVTKVYDLDIGTLEDVAQGSKADGESIAAGTDGYFNIFFSAKTRIEANSKSFADGFAGTKRLNYGGSTKIEDPILNAVQIKTAGTATVKIWWVSGGDGREIGIYDTAGTVVAETAVGSIKNDLYVSELTVEQAGTYYIGNVGGNNNHYRIEVTETSGGGAKPERGAWANVAAPVIVDAADHGEGEIVVTVNANVGYDGADELVVTMMDATGKELATRNSIAEKNEHTLRFAPEDSGQYTFKAEIRRQGEIPKQSAQSVQAGFVLLLTDPILISATSKGGGKVEVIWGAVKEAVSYEIYYNDTLAGSTSDTKYTVEGLTIGEKYSFKVVAVRGGDSTTSNEISITVSEEEKRAWGFTHYGPSTNADNNGYVGSLAEDGYVTVYSEGGKGKIVPASVDGVAFYYTAVPTEYNFTLRAKVSVDSWTYSNGQEGFGLMVTDRLGVSGDTSNFWNNQYMALATKIEYRYDSSTETIYDLNGPGTKYTMKLGLGTIAKTGVTLENLPLFEANDTDTINTQFSSLMTTLESGAAYWAQPAGTYNVIGNYTNDVTGSIEKAMLTEFILEIQKNNTGYFITYYDAEGNIITQQKYYGADDLNQLDPDYVYAGFFAARNARATFSDVEFTTILASEDAPAEEKPVIKVDPTMTITSPTVTTSKDYTVSVDTNVSGTVKITVNNEVLVDGDVVTGGVRYYKDITLKNFGENSLRVDFMPDPDQDLGPDMELSNTRTVTANAIIMCNRGNYHRKTIYVSPTGLPTGTGSKEYPFDIYTAVNNATPGQTILLMEGTYKLDATVRIQRGMDGTEDAPIRMIADPEASSRPVLDFQGLVAGIVHGGDYWYFAGFDVTNSQAGQKGFQVSGNYNTLDQIHAYYNGNTGIQISRYSGTDLFPDWPAYNLILNCTSYGNADPGYEDADGFAAKLTVGEGNVFDGCVAYNNADDGWDLYAKVETGCIGAVTIRNCVAYANGILEDGTIAGNGNGFKLGGESLSGKHVLENSYAFFNRAKGIDSNSCPDVTVINCVSYNNGTHNVAFYTNNAANTDFSATGIISFKDGTIPYEGALSTQDNLKPKGTQDSGKYLGNTNYYWYGESSINGAGTAVIADMFVSLEFKGVARKADGTIDMQGFLELNETGPEDAGVQEGGMPSVDIGQLPEDLEHAYTDVWVNTDLQLHWRECECGDKTDIGEHDLVWVVDKEATPTATGLRHRECTVCGHKKAAVTIYYEEQNPSQPGSTPTDPTTPSADPSDEEPAGMDPMVIVIIIVAAVAVVGVGAFLVVKFVIKKKEN